MQAFRPRATARLAVLLAVLAGVGTYVLAAGLLSSGHSHATGLSACLSRSRPQVVRVSPKALGPLREAVARVLPERLGRLYEEGTIESANAYNDDLPLPPPVSAAQRRPGGYEMRWWAPNGDDVVADVFVFASRGQASLFVRQAAGTRCRARARAQPAPLPALAQNLAWLNPDSASEADVYLQRGSRVYRVADAPASPRGRPASAHALAHAFLTIDTLACLLPHVHCAQQRPTVPT